MEEVSEDLSHLPEKFRELARRLREEQAKPTDCDHEGWNFKQHGRCCWKCGTFMVDWGD